MIITTELFIIKANFVHPDKYDYSLVEYSNSKTKVTVICQKHGKFQIRPNNLLNGQECERCAVEKRSNNRSFTKDEFVLKANNVHNFKYSYEKTVYKNWKTKIVITCSKHGDFLQTPHSHSIGKSGCNKCTHKQSYSKTQWVNMCKYKKCIPIIYIIKCFNKNEEFVKIGITSNTIKYRFKQKSSLPYKYEVIKETKGSPEFIFDEEHRLHNIYKNYKYTPLLNFNGKTECFKSEIVKHINDHYM